MLTPPSEEAENPLEEIKGESPDVPESEQGGTREPLEPEEVVVPDSPETVQTESAGMAPDTQPEEEKMAEIPQTSEAEMSEVSQRIFERLVELEQKLDLLSSDFTGKLRNDSCKQIIIDRQHEELEALRRAEFSKLSNAIIHDVIAEIDSAEKSVRYFDAQECTPENYEKMKKLLLGTAESLIDLLERNEVYTYRSEPGSVFNPKRQRVLRVEHTDDPTLDKTIKESMRAGFERDERPLRPELVAVYALRRESPSTSN